MWLPQDSGSRTQTPPSLVSLQIHQCDLALFRTPVSPAIVIWTALNPFEVKLNLLACTSYFYSSFTEQASVKLSTGYKAALKVNKMSRVAQWDSLKVSCHSDVNAYPSTFNVLSYFWLEWVRVRRMAGESSPGSLQETSVSLQLAQPLITWVLLMYSFAPFVLMIY